MYRRPYHRHLFYSLLFGRNPYPPCLEQNLVQQVQCNKHSINDYGTIPADDKPKPCIIHPQEWTIDLSRFRARKGLA